MCPKFYPLTKPIAKISPLASNLEKFLKTLTLFTEKLTAQVTTVIAQNNFNGDYGLTWAVSNPVHVVYTIYG